MQALQTVPKPASRLDRAPELQTATDIMTPGDGSVHPETPIHEAARLLLAQERPGLPVVDSAGLVVGVLTERDLVERLGPRRRRPWWHLLVDRARLAVEYRRSAGITVADVMTQPAASVSPAASLESVAALLQCPDVGLVLVVSADRPVGTIDRRDLVKGRWLAPAAQIRCPDPELAARMQERMAQESWISKPRPAVEARDGVVAIWGVVDSDAEKAALVTMARSIPGCRGIDDHLVVKGAMHRYHEIV